MTTNAFIFSWDIYGVEAIVPISQYEHIERDNTMRRLREEKPIIDPMNGILKSLMLRAKFNPQRHYEIYAIDCSEEMTEEFWTKQWEEYPQETADLIRERGHRLYSDRAGQREVVIK
jgi:hypothetical protein